MLPKSQPLIADFFVPDGPLLNESFSVVDRMHFKYKFLITHLLCALGLWATFSYDIFLLQGYVHLRQLISVDGSTAKQTLLTGKEQVVALLVLEPDPGTTTHMEPVSVGFKEVDSCWHLKAISKNCLV